jgi:monomeric isocitrate dehydrogenase
VKEILIVEHLKLLKLCKAHPHSMGAWSADSKTKVEAMKNGDFYGSENP